MTPSALPTRRQAYAACALAAVAILACGGLFDAALLVPAPVAVIPLLTLVCIGCPLALAWSVPTAIAVLRTPCPAPEGADAQAALDAGALKALRRHLARLPETQHPLGY